MPNREHQGANVCFVYKEDFPWDIRVEKIINSLLSRDFSVTLVCQNLNAFPRRSKIGRLEVRRLPNFESMPNFANKLINLALWFNPFWLFSIYQAAKQSRSSVLIVRDLPLMPAGLIVGRLLRLRTIFDMAECYPEMYASVAKFQKRSLSDVFLKSPSAARLMERLCCRYSDHIFVMIEESRDRLIALGVSNEKISIVSNTPLLSNNEERHHKGHELRLVYVGFLTKLRGLDLLIRAVDRFTHAKDGGKSIKVDIVGNGAEKENLVALVKDLGMEDIVHIHGWLGQKEVDALMKKSNVGALTYRVCSHWNHTIPNKIFDYMKAGLPIIATNVTPIARILQKTKSGIVGDEKKILEMLIKLKNPKYRQTLGRNGQKSILKEYNWETDERRLVDITKSLLEKSYV